MVPSSDSRSEIGLGSWFVTQDSSARSKTKQWNKRWIHMKKDTYIWWILPSSIHGRLCWLLLALCSHVWWSLHLIRPWWAWIYWSLSRTDCTLGVSRIVNCRESSRIGVWRASRGDNLLHWRNWCWKELIVWSWGPITARKTCISWWILCSINSTISIYNGLTKVVIWCCTSRT